MITLCPLESPIPPEAPEPCTALPGSFAADPSFRRFSEADSATLVWNPDTPPHGRVTADEAILLESRGVTSQTGVLHARRLGAPQQAEIWRSSTIHKNSVSAKLRAVGMLEEAAKLELCHSYYTVCVCSGCNTVRKFPNRCDLFFCPECAHSLSRERKRQVEWWLPSLHQPKHVVLTVKNIPDLSAAHLGQLKNWFARLRRRKICSNWVGGFYSLEVTNEGKGWHLHLHILVEAKWIDKAQLSAEWNSVTNGFGRIVHVRDCRGTDFLQEVSKYIVKGPQLAAWPAEQIKTFVQAFSHKRTFGVFGSLYAKRTQFAEFIAQLKQGHKQCDCGCSIFRYYTESEWEISQLKPDPVQRQRPPPPPPVTPDLFPPLNHWRD